MFINNEQIALRALEPEDLDVLYKWENDSRLWYYGSTLTPYSKFTLREYLANSSQDIFTSQQLRLMIVELESGRAIGTIDLYDFDAMNQRAGIGILLDNEYRNKGYGTQALALLEKYASQFLLMHQLYAHVPKRNEASLKLFGNRRYEQTGLLRDWIKTPEGFEDVLVMQLTF